MSRLSPLSRPLPTAIFFSGGNPAVKFKNDINAYSPTAFYDANSSALYQANTASGDLADADGDVVGYWEDLSGNGYHVTQGTTANKPTWRTNAINTNLSAVRFDGTDDFLQNTSFPDFGDNYTAFIIRKHASGGDASQGLFEVSNGTVSTGFAALTFGNESYWRARDASIVRNLTNGLEPVNDLWRIQSMHNTGSQLQFWINDTSQGTVAYTAPNPNTLNQLDVGRINSSGFNINGDISTLVIFNSTLSTANRNAIEAILNNRYGVY